MKKTNFVNTCRARLKKFVFNDEKTSVGKGKSVSDFPSARVIVCFARMSEELFSRFRNKGPPQDVPVSCSGRLFILSGFPVAVTVGFFVYYISAVTLKAALLHTLKNRVTQFL